MTKRSRNRREVLLAGSGAAALSALNVPLSLAQTRTSGIRLPPSPFSRLTGALGSTGPWGDVYVREVRTGVVPIYVSTPGRGGIIDLSRRRAQISLGSGSIVLTSAGIRAGGTLRPWNKESITDLLKRLQADEPARRSLLELRAALITTYPHAVSTSKTRSDSNAANAVMAMARGMGQQAAPRRSDCTTVTVIDTIVHTVEDVVEVWLTAEERFNACVNRKVREGIPGGEAAAMVVCALEGFVDILVGTYTVLRTFTEEVEKTYVRCAINQAQQLIDFFKGTPVRFPDGLKLPGLSTAASLPDGDYTSAARDVLKMLDKTVKLSAFTRCLLEGQWSFAAAETPVRIGSTGFDIPYGVKVCITAECARAMRFEDAVDGLPLDAEATMAMLAELSPELFVAYTSLLIAIPAGAGIAGAASMTPFIVVLAFLLLAIYYAAAIRAQLLYVTDEAMADGKVCIEHPSFVVAAMAVPTTGYSLLIPPIVTG